MEEIRWLVIATGVVRCVLCCTPIESLCIHWLFLRCHHRTRPIAVYEDARRLRFFPLLFLSSTLLLLSLVGWLAGVSVVVGAVTAVAATGTGGGRASEAMYGAYSSMACDTQRSASANSIYRPHTQITAHTRVSQL